MAQFIFEDKMGFRYTVCENKYQLPPEIYKFYIDSSQSNYGEAKLKLTKKFKLIGKLGNTAAYIED